MLWSVLVNTSDLVAAGVELSPGRNLIHFLLVMAVILPIIVISGSEVKGVNQNAPS